MSLVMEAAMRAWERGLSSVPEKKVCSSHIDDYAVRLFIKREGEKDKCDYCGKHKIVVDLDLLMEFLTDALTHFFTDPANFMSYVSAEGGYQGEYDGPWEMLESLGLPVIDDQLNDDIYESLDHSSAWADEGSAVSDFKYEGWLHFKYIVKHQSRFLFQKNENFMAGGRSVSAESFLKELARDIKRQRMVTLLPIGTAIYRCRQHRNKAQITLAKHICAPEMQFAIYPNRMSPAGVSMFYGAFDAKTAMLETLSQTEKTKRYYTIAEFKTTENLRVIDLSKLPYISPFDQKKWDLFDKIEFLNKFLDDFSAPVSHNGKEHIEYVPTQIITEYFRYNFRIGDSPVDGIIYPSSKNKLLKACVFFMDHWESLRRLTLDPVNMQTKKMEFIRVSSI